MFEMPIRYLVSGEFKWAARCMNPEYRERPGCVDMYVSHLSLNRLWLPSGENIEKRRGSKA